MRKLLQEKHLKNSFVLSALRGKIRRWIEHKIFAGIKDFPLATTLHHSNHEKTGKHSLRKYPLKTHGHQVKRRD